MKRTIALFFPGFMLAFAGIAQVGIGTGGNPPHPSSMMEVKSVTSGMLIPRMTLDQAYLITDKSEGLLVFCTDCGPHGSLSVYAGGKWKSYGFCQPSVTTDDHKVLPGIITWRWHGSEEVTGYKWNANPNYATAVTLGNTTEVTENTVCSGSYTHYLWAFNSCGVSQPVILTRSIAATPPLKPTKGTPVRTFTTIQWKWRFVEGATGYKWSELNNIFSADDMGTATSYTESNLPCGTTYTRYVWAYNGCGYSTPLSITSSTTDCVACGTPFVDPREGESYNTVQIGIQCWMAENLNAGTMILRTENQKNDGIIEKFCMNDNSANCDIYGGLYQWNELMQYVITPGTRGICPEGWHLPSDAEWTILTDYLGSELIAGGQMKEAGLAHWHSPNTGASNSSGFSGLPGGFTESIFSFQHEYYMAFFWSSSYYIPPYSNAYTRMLYFDRESVARSVEDEYKGLSCRCVQD